MKNPIKTPYPVLFEDEKGTERFLNNLEQARGYFDSMAKDWNALGGSHFDLECINKASSPEYFKNRFLKERSESIQASILPFVIKSKLMEELAPNQFPEALNRILNKSQTHSITFHRWSVIYTSFGTIALEIKTEYFKLSKNGVDLIENIKEVVAPLFSIIGDSEIKIEAFKRMQSLIESLNDSSRILTESGLHNAYRLPIVGDSEFIVFNEESKQYTLKKEAFLFAD